MRKLPNHSLFVSEVREEDSAVPIRGVLPPDIITAVNDMYYRECDLLQRIKESKDLQMQVSRHQYPLCATIERCHYFHRGCMRGNACRFKHVDDEEPDSLREEELRLASGLGLCKAYDEEVARNAGGHANAGYKNDHIDEYCCVKSLSKDPFQLQCYSDSFLSRLSGFIAHPTFNIYVNGMTPIDAYDAFGNSSDGMR